MVDLSTDSLPEGLALDIVDTLAYFKMAPEVRHILGRFDPREGAIVTGSALKLRLDLLFIEDKLENALAEQDQEEPSKSLEELLDGVNMLYECLARTDKIKESKKAGWRMIKNSIVRQAALAHIRAQEPAQPCDWSAVSTHGYMDVVNRLLPQMDVDMDTLEDEEQLEIVCARAQRRTLGDIFVDKHRVVSSLKMRALLTENCLEAFERQMKEFIRALDRALLPTPKLIENHLDVYLADVDEVSGADIQRSASPKTHSIDEAPSSSRPGAKRKADASNLGTPHNVESAAHKLFALSAANGELQQDLAGRRPGTVAAALAVAENLPEPSSRGTITDGGAGSEVTVPSRRTGAGGGAGTREAVPSRRTVADGGAASETAAPSRRSVASGGAGSGAIKPSRRTSAGGGSGSETAAPSRRTSAGGGSGNEVTAPARRTSAGSDSGSKTVAPSRRTSAGDDSGNEVTAPARRTSAGSDSGSKTVAPSRRTSASDDSGSETAAPSRRTRADGGSGSDAAAPSRRTVADGGSGSEMAAGSNRMRSRGPSAMLSSQGEQVNFDDSQSVDEPQTRPSLRGRRTPEPGTPVRSPPRQGKARIRVPWTDEEEANLRAAVAEFGKGQWVFSLQQYTFNKCRTTVDLKDKWRNIERKELGAIQPSS